MEVKILKNFKPNVKDYSREIQRVKLGGGYVADNMEKFLPYLNFLRSVIIATPMGSGKNTFIEKLFCENPATKKMRLLYVSNRCMLDREIKKRISEKLGIYPHIDAMGLGDIDDFGNITVLTYQALAHRLRDLNWCKQFDMAVFDECHFFCSDATFNKECGHVLRKIPKSFDTAIRIYMTATVDIVLPYIVDAECNELAKLRWSKRNLPNTEYAKKVLQNCFDNDSTRNLVWDEMAYALEYPVPLVFEQTADFSYINLRFLFEEKDIIKTINSSKFKSLVFVDDKEYGENLAETIDADFVDADSKYKITNGSNVLNDLISSHKLNRNLISTSVLCNGINIKDPTLKNIFIRSDDKSTFIQMLGRKRVKKGEKVNVYVIMPSKTTISRRLNSTKRILSYISMSKENSVDFMNMLTRNLEMYTTVKDLVFTYNNSYSFDFMTEEMFRRSSYNYENVLKMIDDENCERYCKTICDWLNITFEPSMIIRDDKIKSEFLAWLEGYVNRELDEEALIEFSTKFHNYAKMVYKDSYTGRSDRISKYKALNGSFKKLGLEYYFEFKDSIYVLVCK